MSGKTALNLQLLRAVPESHGLAKVVLAAKPRDRTLSVFTEEANYREVQDWPPRKKLFAAKPDGYTVWPPQSMDDPEADDERLNQVFTRAVMNNYKKGNCIILADELYGLLDLGLKKPLLAVLQRGMGMKAGLWMCAQQGKGTVGQSFPGYVLTQPSMYYFAHESVSSAREVYKNISGDFDPDFIEQITMNLPRYWWLHTNSGGEACIIRAA